MLLGETLERFVGRSPFAVMVRGVLENLLCPAEMDKRSARVAKRQYTRKLSFSALVDLMGVVVCKIRPSMHAAILARQDEVWDQWKAYSEPQPSPVVERHRAQEFGGFKKVN